MRRLREYIDDHIMTIRAILKLGGLSLGIYMLGWGCGWHALFK